jgi:hypothetical protein
MSLPARFFSNLFSSPRTPVKPPRTSVKRRSRDRAPERRANESISSSDDETTGSDTEAEAETETESDSGSDSDTSIPIPCQSSSTHRAVRDAPRSDSRTDVGYEAVEQKRLLQGEMEEEETENEEDGNEVSMQEVTSVDKPGMRSMVASRRALKKAQIVQDEVRGESSEGNADGEESADEEIADGPENPHEEEGERHRSYSPSLPPQVKGDMIKEKGHERQPLSELTLGDTDSTQATTTQFTQKSDNVKVQLTEKAWRKLSDNKAWNLSPNRKALELIHEAQYLKLNPASMIQKSIGEPEYALRDIEVRDGLWQVMNQMESFSKAYFAFDISVLSWQLASRLCQKRPSR